jgi:SAM-dependent methyltransferase
MNKLYVQYGCGLSAPKEWTNFDVSPSLKIQKIPLIGKVISKKFGAIFPDNVLFGDIIQGLPLQDNSCDGLFCSHVLEHLSLNDFRIALKNSYKIVKPGGVFRCIVPDLELAARNYIKDLDAGKKTSSVTFMGIDTLIGLIDRPKGIKGFVSSYFGNHQHLWMWDYSSLSYELEKCGFKNIKRVYFNDSDHKMFNLLEDPERFLKAVAIECEK